LAGVSGCAPKEEIEAYTAPAERFAPTKRVPVRLLAALVPVSDREYWVFKVSGRENLVTETESAIVAFLKTVKLGADKDEKISWKVPNEWVEQPGDGKFRYRTFEIPTTGDELELTLSHFPHQRMKLLENINRWRGQINRNPITNAEIPLVSRTIPTADGEATLVDVKGYTTVQDNLHEPFTYDVPASWERPNREVPFAQIAFLPTQAGEAVALVTVSSVKGSQLDNVNRWRTQLGLKETTQEQLDRSARSLQVAGRGATYVDLAAERERPDERYNRILGVIFDLGGEQWIVKMAGAEIASVEKEKRRFERFTTSLKPR
jgi:hypothetical protein